MCKVGTTAPGVVQAAAEKMEAARAGQKAITGTEADLRKLGMVEARERLLELGIKDAEIASAGLSCRWHMYLGCRLPCGTLSLQPRSPELKLAANAACATFTSSPLIPVPERPLAVLTRENFCFRAEALGPHPVGARAEQRHRLGRHRRGGASGQVRALRPGQVGGVPAALPPEVSPDLRKAGTSPLC